MNKYDNIKFLEFTDISKMEDVGYTCVLGYKNKILGVDELVFQNNNYVLFKTSSEGTKVLIDIKDSIFVCFNQSRGKKVFNSSSIENIFFLSETGMPVFALNYKEKVVYKYDYHVSPNELFQFKLDINLDLPKSIEKTNYSHIVNLWKKLKMGQYKITSKFYTSDVYFLTYPLWTQF
ncbi:MAG: hypothetical protein IT244_01115 [Bacteroidia bacterium]|nr:hypothetical protein [Bacteroidia bacterium]